MSLTPLGELAQTEQRDHAKLQKRLLVVTVVMSILMIGAFSVAAWSFANAHHSSCQARNTSLDVTHDILKFTEPTDAALAKLPVKQRREIAAFYDFAFKRIQDARCS